jgi:cysteine desulfurase
MPRIAALRDRLEAQLTTRPGVEVPGGKAARLPNTLCIARGDMSAESQFIALDLAGIAVSAGAACSSGKVAQSHVLQAMGVAPEIARCAIRISLGWESTAAEIERLIAVWSALAPAAAA